jgi:hypothetical protein
MDGRGVVMHLVMSWERKSWLLGWRCYLGKVIGIMMAYFGLGGILNFRICCFILFCFPFEMRHYQTWGIGAGTGLSIFWQSVMINGRYYGWDLGTWAALKGVVVSWLDNWQARAHALGNQAQASQDSSPGA